MATPLRADKQPATQHKKLKKGELLFSEGDSSRSMYFLKSGMIRIFKKKGDSMIEIDTIRSGSVIGELAFLDGNPRSASGEALMDCELTEISGATFQHTFKAMPDWLKILLKTIVSRLRAASNKIRQLESASTALEYGQNGKSASKYVYLSISDVLKLGSAVLLVAARNGEDSADGIKVRASLLQRYANQIMGVPMAKLTSMIDIFAQNDLMLLADDGETYVKNINLLEKFISYYNEENLLEEAKKHNISLRSFVVMSYIVKYADSFAKDEATGIAKVNLAQIKRAETAAAGGKEPFRLDEAAELVKMGYITELDVKSTDEVFTNIKVDSFTNHYKFQRIAMSINAVNEQKRKSVGR